MKGVSTASIRTTGHEKSHFTVMLACTADGGKLPPYVIFKRKTLPKGMQFPRGIHPRSSKKLDGRSADVGLDQEGMVATSRCSSEEEVDAGLGLLPLPQDADHQGTAKGGQHRLGDHSWRPYSSAPATGRLRQQADEGRTSPVLESVAHQRRSHVHCRRTNAAADPKLLKWVEAMTVRVIQVNA